MLKLDTLDEAVKQGQLKRPKIIVLNNKEISQAGLISYAELNLNEELSELLLNVPLKERRIRVATLIEDLIESLEGEIVLVIGINILFDRALEVDPLRVLARCAKNKTILVIWPGDVRETSLQYAVPDHLEYRIYKGSDLSDVILLG